MEIYAHAVRFNSKTGRCTKNPQHWIGYVKFDDGTVYDIPGCNSKRHALRLAQEHADKVLNRSHQTQEAL